MNATNDTIAISLETARLLALAIRTLARECERTVDPAPSMVALAALETGAAQALALAKAHVDEPGGEAIEAAGVELSDALSMLARDFRDGTVRWSSVRVLEDFVSLYIPRGRVRTLLENAIDVAVVAAHTIKQRSEQLAGLCY